jgi:hypothetical protein
MTIQAGLTGPAALGGANRIRVWSTARDAPVHIARAGTGQPIAGASVVDVPPPPELQDHPDLQRRVIEIANLPPNTFISITIAGETCTVLTPPLPDQELRLLVGSCFHLDDDRGQLAAAYANLRPHEKPHLRLHCGDQLYLDAGPLPRAPSAFARTHARYRRYWNDTKFSEYLRGGVTLFTPDDHDFWNDYPHRMPHLSRSWDRSWREHAEAADLCHLAYQSIGNPGARTWFMLDLGMVSLFVLDTRTRRGARDRNPPARLFDADQAVALLDWSANLTKPGILLSAMPLFQRPKGKFLFFTTDHNYLAYPSEARVIWRAVEQARHDVIVLAGDVHQGRFTEWRTGTGPNTRRHHEVVSSPLRLLGWPRVLRSRDRARLPPSGLSLGAGMGRRDWHAVQYGTAVDHFTLCTFRKRRDGRIRLGIEVRRIPDAQIPISELDGHYPCTANVLLQ